MLISRLFTSKCLATYSVVTFPPVIHTRFSNYLKNSDIYLTASGVNSKKAYFSNQSINFENLETPIDSEEFDARFRRYKLDNEDEVFDGRSLSPEKWKEIVDDMANRVNGYYQPVFDTYIINESLKHNNFDVASSYVQFLDTRNEKLNFAAMSYYLILMGQNSSNIEKASFTHVYKLLTEEKFLPHPIIMNIIKALSLFRMWDEAFKYLNHIEKESDSFATIVESYNFILSSMAQLEGIGKALNFIKTFIDKVGPTESDISIYQETYKTFFESIWSIQDASKREEHVLQLFQLLKRAEVSLSEENIDRLMVLIPKEWKCSKVRIKNMQVCNTCGSNISLLPLNESIFQKLKSACEAHNVKGSDIFRTTTPEEWDLFTSFLKINGPFDLVIDGLNVLYLASNSQARALLTRLSLKNRVLLISRKHFLKRIVSIFGTLDVGPTLKFFFVKDLTKDDPFILYATLYSGMHCKFLTRDYFRNHKFLLGDPLLRRQFYYWQNLSQIFVTLENGKLRLKQPSHHHRIIQYSLASNSWHVPFNTGPDKAYFDSRDDWLCIKGSKKTKSSILSLNTKFN